MRAEILLPLRTVVERLDAWLAWTEMGLPQKGKRRRLAKDWKTTFASAEAWILVAHIRLLTRRIARRRPA